MNLELIPLHMPYCGIYAILLLSHSLLPQPGYSRRHALPTERHEHTSRVRCTTVRYKTVRSQGNVLCY